MPPHTISPTPDSQGLGISLSTLSPPPTQDGHHPRQPVTFTGIGAMPRSGSQPAKSSQEEGKASTADPSRPLPPTSTTGAPLYQAGIALRPTHTRGGSKGFNTFSALAPAQAQSQVREQASPRTAQQQLPPSVRGFVPKGDMSPDMSVESSAFGGDDDDDDTTLRQGSHPTNGASGSRHSRRNKSVDFLRSLSGKNGQETLGGGAYVPLAGSEEVMSTPLREATLDSREWGGRPQERPERHSTASSSGATGAVTHNDASLCGPAPSDNNHSSFYPNAQLQPQIQTTRQPPAPVIAARPAPGPRASRLSRGMSRSKSTPHDLQAVPEGSAKRYSDPSTGTHSKNRVLRDAENGGMMLAFSPGGDYRAGQAIMGAGSALLQTPVSPVAPRAPSTEEVHEESLRSRPWSNSTMSEHMRPQTLGHRGRSLSEGAGVLARQGTLFHPGASKQRSSAELGLMLGQPRSRRLSGNKILPPPDLEAWTMAGGSSDEVRLEASKKKKARVEVDVVLERECVVEGGEIRGRLEITVNGGKRGEGLRVAGGKARVVGFEDVSADSRHIFYHHSHCLPVFDPQGDVSTPVPSLFASGPDEDGYRLASEGTHSIPFRMRLPLGGTAKGSFSSPNSKGPCVRYVVVGSVKLFIPSTMKRSIAHFYRPIVVLPYLNPSIVLAPSVDPIENTVERGLGWSLGGEKGKVEVRVSLGRKNWVAGQRAWCEVGIKNNSSRKIKSITLALLQTVQTFHPDSSLNTGDFAARLRRRSANLTISRDDPGTPEMDACQTSTTRRKLTEEVLEADSTGHGEGRVTGKAWWTGVEAGEKDHWDMSLLIPNGLVTIRRTRLIEVTYTLRVTVNGSIYVDVPINLINFLSIDPPPMPGDAFRVPVPRAVATNVSGVRPPPSRLQPIRMASDNSLNSAGNPARASSTTLHIDALLQAGRARADAESQAKNQGTENAQQKGKLSRPQSIGSEYTLPHARSLADMLALDPPALPEMGSDHRRPPAQTMTSFMSERSDQTHDASMYCDEPDGEADAMDQSLAETRRKAGRQKSLVLAITRAEQRALEAMEELDINDPTNGEYHALSPGKESIQTGEFMPDGTPFEHEVYEIGEMPPIPDLPVDHDNGDRRLRVRNHTPELENYETRDDSLGMEDQAGLLDLVKDHLPQIRSSSPFDLSMTPKDRESRYDYAPERTDFNPTSPLMDQQQQDDSLRARYADLDPYSGMTSEQYANRTRERYGSFAPSEQESEVGQVVDVVKRNLSVRLPARLVPASTGASDQTSAADSHEHKQQQDQQDQQSGPKVSYHLLAAERIDTRPRSPRGSAPPIHPSPLRQVQQLPAEGEGGRKVSRPLPRFPSRSEQKDRDYESSDISPRSTAQAQMPSHPVGSVQHRSQLRHQISMESKYGSTEDEAPGLAPSVASDSASSEGHLESPPGSTVDIGTGTLPDAAQASESTFGQSWTPASHSHEVYLQTGAADSTAHQDALSSDSHTTSMSGSPTTVESMLPSVRTKIHQLNTRDEALRKFSVSGAISPSTPRGSVSSNPRNSISVSTHQRTPPMASAARYSIISPSAPMVTPPISTVGRATPHQSPESSSHILDSTHTTPTKRRSYTTALGPRHARTTSNESGSSTSHGRSPSTHRVGNTTYLTKRSFAQSHHVSPSKAVTHPSPSVWTQSSGPGSPTRSMYISPYDLQFQEQAGQSKLERNMSISSTSTSATTIEAALMRRPGGPRQPLPPSPAKKSEARMMGPRVAGVGARYSRVSEEEDSDGLV